MLAAGAYYVQSIWHGNEVIQPSALEPGSLTDATVHHRAAQ